MTSARIIGAFAVSVLALQAEDFTLKFFGDGPIVLHTTLVYEGRGERLSATAKNDSGTPIQRAKICVTSPSMTKGCAFEVWNTAVWEPGAELSWNVITALKFADLSHNAMISEYASVKPPAVTQIPSHGDGLVSIPAKPKPLPVAQESGPSVEGLTNVALIRMARAGLSEEVVLGMIRNQPGKFVVTPDAMISLKEAGVSDGVIAAILTKQTAKEPVPSVPEIGVYYRSDGTWVDLKPEIVDWKTGGVVKHVTSLGVVKGDVNGLVNGPKSPNTLSNPIEILIYSIEGVAATEYQLVRLHEHDNRREFRTITGGVFHLSEGTMRDMVEFDSRKVAPRLYRISFSSLEPGEYGFIPSNSELPNRASASLGKIFTFHVSE